jgi:chemotaxis protein MotB
VTQEESAQRERELQESSKARRNLVDRLQKEISEGSIKISQIKNKLTVQIVDKILFSSGSSDVTNKGKTVLAKVSAVLKSVKENDIRIEGHTDNVPIGPRIKKKFPTNWELSTSRATHVVRFLTEQGVDPNNLIAIGLSQYRPVASNDTDEGKQRNRRIEIVLFPKDIQKIASVADPS